MKISPINFGSFSAPKQVNKAPVQIEQDLIPVTVRKNTLADMEFNIIADTIRCQNLKNQMNVRLMNLKRNLNNCMARDTYS